jgi:hypothetical protein
MEFRSMEPSWPGKVRRVPRHGHGGPRGREGAQGVEGTAGWEIVLLAWMVKVGYRFSDTSGYRLLNWC